MVLPKNWFLLSLEEIAAEGRGTFSNGPFGSDLVKADLTDTGIPIIYIRDIRDGYYNRVSTSCVTEEKAEQLSACWVSPGDVLVAKVGDPPGTAAIYPEDQAMGIVTQDVVRLRLNPEVADPAYVRHWLNSPLGQYAVRSITVEATRARFPLGDFKKLAILLPPIAQQRRIAEILDRADAIRRKRQEAIRLTEELLRSAFLEMFGDPVTNPKGWTKEPLGELCTIRRGASPRPIDEYLGGSVPWVKIGDGTGSSDIYIYKTAEAVTPAGAGKSVYLEPGSLIFANCGVSLGFARILAISGCIHDGWLSFSEISQLLNKIYLLKLLNSVTNHFRQIAPSGTQPNLNTGIMKEFSIPIPPIELQNEFAEFVTKISSAKSHQVEGAKITDELFYSLLQRAFRGEL